MDPFRSNPEDASEGEEEFQAACYRLLTQIGDTAWDIFSAIEDLPYWQPKAEDLPEVERLHRDFMVLAGAISKFLPPRKEST